MRWDLEYADLYDKRAKDVAALNDQIDRVEAKNAHLTGIVNRLLDGWWPSCDAWCNGPFVEAMSPAEEAWFEARDIWESEGRGDPDVQDES